MMKKSMILSFIMIVAIMPVVLFVLEASGYAGTIDDTQLGFNAEIIKAYFSLMSFGGLFFFALGNLLDYVFIISYGVFFYNSTRYLSWNYPSGSIRKKVGNVFTWIGVTCAIFDGIENIFLFSMVANPVSFAGWLAIAHSIFATFKFNLMYITIGWLVLAVILNKTIFRPSERAN